MYIWHWDSLSQRCWKHDRLREVRHHVLLKGFGGGQRTNGPSLVGGEMI